MQQIKLFNGSTKSVEHDVNHWLKQNGNCIKVMNIKLSAADEEGLSNIYVMVAYVIFDNMKLVQA